MKKCKDCNLDCEQICGKHWEPLGNNDIFPMVILIVMFGVACVALWI
ncbi:MAG: hypothetical protein [Siphoviridae sp. ct7UA22]|nr:MAG: hypothetical protein [Siphoviridae sp. ct7UA22]